LLGSAQVRLEKGGQVWVVSGDYKTEPDPTCESFEPLPCHTFVTESTFGLPVFRWRPQRHLMAEINGWWRDNRDRGRTSLLFAYALGKAQRVLAALDPSTGPIYCHGAVQTVNDCYRRQGIRLPDTRKVTTAEGAGEWKGALVIAPPSAESGPWTGRFENPSRAVASGWMSIRGHRRRRAVDRGFALSDHCDWEGLNRAIRDTGAETVWITHGYASVLARWLRETGIEAHAVSNPFEGPARDDADIAV
jgi:putative mRNA 3-end processing factor